MKKNKLSLTTLLLVNASLVPNSFSKIDELQTYTSHEGKLENLLNRLKITPWLSLENTASVISAIGYLRIRTIR